MAQGKGDKLPIESKITRLQVMDMVADGKSRSSIMKFLQDQGMGRSGAEDMYYNALKDMTPSPDLLDDYKKGIIQVNLGRLEKIIDETIGGNYQNKQVALKAIAEINKMLGLNNDTNSVTIANNKEGDQIIQIKFE